MNKHPTSYSREIILQKITHLENQIRILKEELDKRGKEDSIKYGIWLADGLHVFDTQDEAFNFCKELDPNDESLPYKVHQVYL